MAASSAYDTSTSVPSGDFDYVIVAGGLSGLVASRFSEDPDKRILVIEAGASRMGDPRIDTPGLMTALWEDPDYDWEFMSIPQVNMITTAHFFDRNDNN